MGDKNMDNNVPNKNWFEKIFSLDEFKFSALVVTQFVFLGLDVYSFIKYGDIANNLLMCNAYAITAISGVNLIGMAINSYSNRTSMQSQYSQYGINGTNSYQSNSYMNNSMGTNQMPMNNMTGINQSPTGMNDVPINNLNPTTNLNDPPVAQMPIVSSGSTGTKSPV